MIDSTLKSTILSFRMLYIVNVISCTICRLLIIKKGFRTKNMIMFALYHKRTGEDKGFKRKESVYDVVEDNSFGTRPSECVYQGFGMG